MNQDMASGLMQIIIFIFPVLLRALPGLPMPGPTKRYMEEVHMMGLSPSSILLALL